MMSRPPASRLFTIALSMLPALAIACSGKGRSESAPLERLSHAPFLLETVIVFGDVSSATADGDGVSAGAAAAVPDAAVTVVAAAPGAEVPRAH